MAIQLSSNFNLNSQLPLDARTVVADVTARDLIPDIQRYQGMIVYADSTNINYQLQGGITNGNWVEFGIGSVPSLQEVTDVNNVTTNSISINEAGGNQVAILGNNTGDGVMSVRKFGTQIKTDITPGRIDFTNASAFSGALQTTNITANTFLEFPTFNTFSATIPISVNGVYANSSGNITVTTGTTETASNGLTKVVNDIKLGGTLTAATTIAANTYGLTLTSLASSSFLIDQQSTGGSGNGIVVGTNGGTAGYFNSGSGLSLQAEGGGTGAVISGNTGGATIGTTSSSGYGARIHSSSSDIVTSSKNILEVRRDVTTPYKVIPADFGANVTFMLTTDDLSTNTPHVANTILSKWTNPIASTRTSEFSITGVNNATTNTLLTLAGSGATKLNKYGVGTFTGTPAYGLATDSSGNVVETNLVKYYIAILTQTGTNAPVANVILNTLGETITWTRTSTGLYKGTKATSFDPYKTYHSINNTGGFGQEVIMRIADFSGSNQIELKTRFSEGAGYGDSVLTLTPIEIRIYP